MSQQPPPYPQEPGNIPNYQQPAPAGDAISTIIPYRNGFALTSYYLGVFSLIPCVGALLGIAAVIFGILGLKAAAKNPQAKGKVHAIVGIVLGGIFGLIYSAIGITIVGAALLHR